MRTAHIRVSILSTSCLFGIAVFVGSGVRAQQPCSITQALRISTAAHIFTVQQERILGDVEAEWVESNYHTIPAEGFAVHLDTVASRILSLFPRGQTQVRIILIDTPGADSFSTGPERIYISRRMITLLKNDDELAGLLGHELAHILTHQNAITVSQLFHEILSVNAVSDRRDISDKLMRVLARIDRDNNVSRKAAQIISRQEGISQYEADRVAIYVLAAAGFSPQAYLDLFNRFTATNGNTASLLSDAFRPTRSNERRLGEINKTLRRLPKPCREILPTPSAEFRAWQAAVVSYPAGPPMIDRDGTNTER
jgi:predicted Zn-dependent protease